MSAGRASAGAPPSAGDAVAADLDRAQVYAAELAAFDGTDLEEVLAVDDVLVAIRAVTSGDWWPGGSVTVKVARSDARSSSTRCGVETGAVASISIARAQATIATAAHELAHALAGVEEGPRLLLPGALISMSCKRSRTTIGWPDGACCTSGSWRVRMPRPA